MFVKDMGDKWTVCLGTGNWTRWSERTPELPASMNRDLCSNQSQPECNSEASAKPYRGVLQSSPNPSFSRGGLIPHEKHWTRSLLLGHHCVFLQLKSASVFTANSRRPAHCRQPHGWLISAYYALESRTDVALKIFPPTHLPSDTVQLAPLSWSPW